MTEAAGGAFAHADGGVTGAYLHVDEFDEAVAFGSGANPIPDPNHNRNPNPNPTLNLYNLTLAIQYPDLDSGPNPNQVAAGRPEAALKQINERPFECSA